MFWIGIRRPILWVAIPSAADIVGHLGERLLLYQVSDKYDANEDSALSASVIRTFDEKLKQSADVVMFSGRKLFQESREPHRYYLEQAVDFEHFATPAAEASPEIAHIQQPILGYFGAMDYVMDTELMAEVSRLRPNWHWVMLGIKSNVVQLSAPNIHFLGSKPYAELPKFIKRFDVCVLPWRQDNAFTSYGSAIKVREYLATGKPVVISPLYEYLQTPGVRIYRSTAEFVALVEDALRNDTPEAKAKRQAVVRGCDWNLRTRQLCSLVQSLSRGEKYTHASPLAKVAQV